MRNIFLILFMAFGVLTSCDKTPQAINYGEDECDFCRMGIVNPTHAAQLVTKKGKNYKFDATECMIDFLRTEIEEEKMLHVLSANLKEPGTLISVYDATFIITENIPSPMGAFLSALNSKEAAVALQKESGGELYTWEEVKKVIANQRH
ncbi:MAG TPA: nitrous oxide reductase accessory protein NosL [Flavobacteriaceae bacterium]|nr:nitrous oxide reductase accessory protein NosL [Flavobacteriaceae bacterium]